MTTNTRTGRLLSVGAAAALASVGMMAMTAPAHAASGNTKVWVCKYVTKPGGNEVLKDGKNPIEVSANAISKGDVAVGYTFADGQLLSKVVQVGGSDPGLTACDTAVPPPNVTPGTVPTVPPGTIADAPGTGAPVTGGEDDRLPLGLLAGGSLLAGAGLLASEARRRRQGAAR